MINKEIQYSRLLFYLILYHYNIKEIKDLQNLCQYTNVVSYYILKYFMLNNDKVLLYIFNKQNIKNFIENIINEILIFDIPSYHNILNDFFKDHK
jgi:hypothetical protein